MTKLIRGCIYCQRIVEKLWGKMEIDEHYQITWGRRVKKEKPLRRRLAVRGRGRWEKDKPPIIGFVERQGRMILEVRRNCKNQTLRPMFSSCVKKGSIIYIDDFDTYNFLEKTGCVHATVNHSAREYARGEVHVNTIEGIWSLVVLWMNAFRGVCKRYLPIYIKSIEFFLNLALRWYLVFDIVAMVLDVCFRAPAKKLFEKLRRVNLPLFGECLLHSPPGEH